MLASESFSPILIGYLAFVEVAKHGMVGGYLVVNEHARPLEFHCTAPVLPSRTHEILYGPTLRSVLVAERIGPALLTQGKHVPSLMITDDPLALELSAASRAPLIGLTSADAEPPVLSWSKSVSGHTLWAHALSVEAEQQTTEVFARIGPLWDMSEPLDRIRAAITEAQRAAA